MVAEPEAYVAFCACDAVIVVVPGVSIVTTLPAIVATFVFDYAYENATGLFELGSTNANDASITLVFVTDDGKLVITTGINFKYNAIPLELIPSPPYTSYGYPFIVVVVNFVYVLFVSRR
jgi:hypothetical protein